MILLDLCWEVCLFLAHHGRVQRESHTKIRSTAIGLKSHYPVSTELGNRLTDINLWHYENSSILWRIVRLKRKDKSAVCWAVLASVCQHCVDFLLVRWTSQPWPQDWKGSVFIPIPTKGNAKECSNYCTIVLISHTGKVMFKMLQAKLQQYMNWELPDILDLEKADEPYLKLPTSVVS